MGNIRRVLLLAGLASLIVATAASTASSGSSSKQRHVTLYLFGKEKVRPQKIYTSLASYCSEWAHGLNSWHHWGAGRTFSDGRLHYSTGRPDCASGSRTARGKVVVSHIQHCRSGAQYGRMHFIYFGHSKYDSR